jgi:serine/threonine protein kinase
MLFTRSNNNSSSNATDHSMNQGSSAARSSAGFTLGRDLDTECPDTQPVSAVFWKLTSSEHNRLLAKSGRDASDNLALARHFRYTNEGDITGNRRLALGFYEQAFHQLEKENGTSISQNGCKANIKQLEESLRTGLPAAMPSPAALFPSSAAFAPATAAVSRPEHISPEQAKKDPSTTLERSASLGNAASAIPLAAKVQSFVPDEVSESALQDNGKLLTELEIQHVYITLASRSDSMRLGRYCREVITHCRYDIYKGDAGEHYAIYNDSDRSEPGCNLYIAREREVLTLARRHRYCYILTKKALYYVGSCYANYAGDNHPEVCIDEMDRFRQELSAIMEAGEKEVYLSPEQIRELITNNGGHIPESRYAFKGGTARIEAAQNLRTGEWCILKTLLLADEEYERLFKNEAAILKKLNRSLGISECPGRGELLMKYVRGCRLVDAVDGPRGRNPHLLVKKAYLAGLIAQKEFMAKGLFHRDITPRNCIVDFSEPTLVANLIDFGTVCHYDPQKERLETLNYDLLGGSIAFMAPETIRFGGRPGLYSQDSEVYAWGMVARFLNIDCSPLYSMTDPNRARRPLLSTVIENFQRHCEDYAKDHPDEAAQVESLLSEARRNRKPNGSEACLTREHPASFSSTHPPVSAASAANHPSEFVLGEYADEICQDFAVSVSATPTAESKNNNFSLGSSIYSDIECPDTHPDTHIKCPDTQPVSAFWKLTSSEHDRLLAKSGRDASDNLALARHFRYTNEGDITGNRRLALDFYKQASSQLKERKILKNGCEANIKQLEESLGIRPSAAVSSTCDSPFAFFPSSAASAPALTAAASQPRRIAPALASGKTVP